MRGAITRRTGINFHVLAIESVRACAMVVREGMVGIPAARNYTQTQSDTSHEERRYSTCLTDPECHTAL